MEIMTLITPELEEQLPPLDDVYKGKPLTVYAKFFMVDGPFTWYVTNYDGDDTLWALVINHAWDIQEQGVVSLEELKGLRGKLKLPVERDIVWEPLPLETLLERLAQNK